MMFTRGQPCGAKGPGEAVFGYGGCNDVRDANEGLAPVPDTDTEGGRLHGLDVVVGVAERDGA